MIFKRKKEKKTKYNFHIISITYVFVLLFLGMMGYICYYSATNRQELVNNSYNSRQQILTAKNIRGAIYASNDEVLAHTVTSEDGSEVRTYPYANEFSHVIGYASNGRAGIEAIGNYYLINSTASIPEKVASDVSGSKYPGDDIYTTLNVKLQESAYQAMGIYRGTIVVTEPATGKILAMVSKPDFDPNQIQTEWDKLVADKESGVLLNRATQGLYPPGSTFKIVTALEYIKENPDTYENYSFQCNGSFTYDSERINCYHGQSHGNENFEKAFAKSCNSAFADIGLRLDQSKFKKTLQDLMFNTKLPIELNYTKSKIDVEKDSSVADMMQNAIGQGTMGMSPMHLNMITCAVANQGMLMKPYLIERIENASGGIVKKYSPSGYKKLMSEEEAEVLTMLMQGVIENGTGSKLKGLSYTAAGKTGSAEYNSIKSDSHAWFTGFAPAENPEVCVTVIIEGAGSGGDYAVPMAKRIFDTYFGD